MRGFRGKDFMKEEGRGARRRRREGGNEGEGKKDLSGLRR